MQEQILQQLVATGLPANVRVASALAAYLEELSKWNRVHNLTAITDPQDMIQRHIVESVALASLVRGDRIVDVGSGAGLPGIPLAIAEPQRSFTLVESRGKRAGFLRHVAATLNLGNVTVEHSRIEDLRPDSPFDTVLARAVAPLPELLRLTRHLFTPETLLLALTGESFAGDSATLEGGFEARRIGEPMARMFRGSLVMVEKTGD